MIDRLKAAVNRFQQRHRPIAFVYGVLKKAGEDRAGDQAALLAYFGFLSIFPLLLFAVTVLGRVLSGNPELQARILDTALAQLPIIGEEIRENIHGLGRSGVALVIGLGGALWGGIGGVRALQNAMDHVWNVPIRKQPGTPARIARGLMTLAIFGAFALVSTGLSGLGAGTQGVHPALRVSGLAGSLALNVILYLLIYKLLTVAEVSWNEVAPGALAAGVAWTVVQSAGNYIVGTRLADASALYGLFGIVIGLLAWLYLGSQITVLGAELNVVRKIRAWPRSIDPEDLTEADKLALARQAYEEERVRQQDVLTRFHEAPRAP